MKKLATLILLIMSVVTTLSAQNIIFPEPAEQKTEEGQFILGRNLVVKGNCPYAKELAKDLNEEIKDSPYRTAKTKSKIVFRLETDTEMKPEEYAIRIHNNKIDALASSKSGLFYAYQTVRQLFLFNDGKIQNSYIHDYPRYKWRGFMLDVSRHFFGKEKVMQYLDFMAMLHLNIFHWHLTDSQGWRIEIKKYPELTRKGGIGNWHDPEAPAEFYTQEDIREIVEYASERHITIVPEIDTPGHCSAIYRAYPEYAIHNENGSSLNPCSEKTFRLIDDIFTELSELFPGGYIHIGGDEVSQKSWKTDPEVLNFMKERGYGYFSEVGRNFTRRIVDIVASKGKTAIAWDEAADAGVSPEKLIIDWWRVRPMNEGNPLYKTATHGYRLIMTPRVPMYGDYVQEDFHKIGRRIKGDVNHIDEVYAFPDPMTGVLKEHENQIMGMQMNMWTDLVGNQDRLDYMSFPRIVAAAESAWSSKEVKDYNRFMQKLPAFLEYLDAKGIHYYNPLNPDSTPEPETPAKVKG